MDFVQTIASLQELMQQKEDELSALKADMDRMASDAIASEHMQYMCI